MFSKLSFILFVFLISSNVTSSYAPSVADNNICSSDEERSQSLCNLHCLSELNEFQSFAKDNSKKLLNNNNEFYLRSEINYYYVKIEPRLNSPPSNKNI